MSLLSTTCRVCLANDREMYRLTNTALEETYERVTSGTLVVEGRPCCVCGVCLSALRRCRRFIDTAREANDALDRWIRNHPHTETLKLTELPLFSFTRRATELIDINDNYIPESGIKQENDTADKEDDNMTDELNENISDDEGNNLKQVIKYEALSDDDNGYTQTSDNQPNGAQMSDNIESHIEMLSNVKCEIILEEMDSTMLNNAGGDTPEIIETILPFASNVEANNPLSSDEDIPLQTFCSRATAKRFKVTESRQIKHRYAKTDPATLPYNEDKQFTCTNNYKTKTRNHPTIHTGEKSQNKSKRNQRENAQNLWTYIGEKPYTCHKCDFKCIRKAELKVHLMSHTGKQPYICDMCNFKCNAKVSLKHHLLTHTGEKPFACDKCDFKCNHRGSLTHHLRTHTGEKPYACNECNFKCSQNSNLKRHLLSHSNKKPFACKRCDYKTSRKDNLQQHLLTHGEKPFICSQCIYKCCDKRALNKHMLKVHASND